MLLKELAPITLLPLFLLLHGCNSQVKEVSWQSAEAAPIVMNRSEKFCCGVSLVAPPREYANNPLATVRAINANYVAVIPYAFSRQNEPAVYYNSSHQWWGETAKGVTKTIGYARAHDLHVLLKPHLWIGHQGWAGDFQLNTEDDYRNWERQYSQYILHFARLADSLDVEMFCIGNEMKILVQKRPQYWRGLIREVRKVYKGKVTYAANWDNFENVSFWNDLDYVGVNAYFPLAAGASPSLVAIKESWQTDKEKLKRLSNKWQRPVIFTEYGYCSMDHATEKPWHNHDRMVVNLPLQERAYQALYEEFWNEPWFSGGFLWKWYAENEIAGGVKNCDYTPQNKPAEQIIKEWYARPFIIDE